MLGSKDLLKKYDLSSVRLVFTGAAPLGKETVVELLRLYPNWHVGQGYGIYLPLSDSTAKLLTWW
jgi:acyl-coenzyme A synthetase/AMP-(fatty) acid ligase